MNIQCAQNDFAKNLQLVSRVAAGKSSLPILANICLVAEKDKLQLTATDLEIGITTTMNAKVEQEGSITLPARLLTDFIANNKDDSLNIKSKDSQVDFESNRYKATMSGIDSSDFPTIPPPGEDKVITLESDLLKRGLQDVLFAAALGDSRPVLNGVLFDLAGDTLTLASTDSYRLSEKIIKLSKKNPGTQIVKVIIPSRAVAEIVRILPEENQDVSIFLNQNQISFIYGQTQVVSRLIEGNFPEYKQIIPTGHATLMKVNKAEFVEVLKVSDLFARDNSHNIKLKIEKGEAQGKFYIKAISSGANKNTSEVTAEIVGSDMEIAFNAKFILDSLNAVSGDIVTIELFDLERPMVIKPVNEENYLNLVMPLRVD